MPTGGAGTAAPKWAPRVRGLRAKPEKFPPGSKKRRGTILEFRLSKPARLLVSVYGPGPSCERLATFTRRGRAGMNRVPFSGTLFGRALPPGRYAIVLEAVRAGRRVRIGRILVVILARDGREGGNRRLAAPDCDGGTAAFLAAIRSGGGDFGSLTAVSNSSSTGDTGAGGVAGVAAGQGDVDEPLLPNLPALPTIPTFPADEPFDVPPWAFVSLVILGLLGAAALLGRGIHRHRDGYRSGWD